MKNLGLATLNRTIRYIIYTINGQQATRTGTTIFYELITFKS